MVEKRSKTHQCVGKRMETNDREEKVQATSGFNYGNVKGKKEQNTPEWKDNKMNLQTTSETVDYILIYPISSSY